ncbi:protein TonB [Sphingomonas zeicaulis]|uniref:TonB family protein n=1 Tax=Sphingomonas zeicaulis TaxID=1632740 RepID=UPI003D1F56DB
MAGAAQRRPIGAAATLAVHGALLAALLLIRMPQPEARASAGALQTFDLPAQTPQPKPALVPAPRASGAAAPANLHSVARPVVAPPAPIEIAQPLAAPPIAAIGPDRSAGATDQAGPGTGAGGTGAGLGSGNGGADTGGGGTRARRIAGAINIFDFPRAARGRASASVLIHLDVGADGRVTGCRVAQSSGDPALDTTTCRLATKRFRYRPATDTSGRAIADVTGWRQDWWQAPAD